MTEIPSDIRKFLYEHVETLEELEVLLLLGRNPDKTFTKEEAEIELKIPFDAVASAFQTLRKTRLCDLIVGGADDAFQLTRKDPLARAHVAKLVALYDTSRFELLKLLSAAAMDRLSNSMTRAFADAFVLGGKKRGKDG
ncbi:MAG: hypothetical protein HOW73_44350 [Polyangiaceae bacterium]|nr:hypothetical protein [Polyangiaceae bacterium]